MDKFRINGMGQGQVDRGQPLSFTFDGRKYQGLQGDSLASALLANGVKVVGRSFKTHRPRGIMSAGPEEAGAIVTVGLPPFEEPNAKATMIPLYEGLVARSVNAWPTAKHDLFGLFGLASPLLVAGFYYKVFKWPGWKWFSPIVRQMAGLGRMPAAPEPDQYEHNHAHPEVLVIGAGAAGLSAALSAALAGLDVMLVDEQSRMGGALLWQGDQKGNAWVDRTLAQLGQMPNVRLMHRTTAIGYYDHNLVTLAQLCHIQHGDREKGVREIFWHVRADKVVLATGAIERPLVFPDNDRPGIFLSSAIRQYLNRYGVVPGRNVVLASNNDSVCQTALDLHKAGINVVGVVDARKELTGDIHDHIRQLGIPLFAGYAVVGTMGKKGIRSVRIAKIDLKTDHLETSEQVLKCDVLGTSGGWQPTVHLHSQSSGKLVFHEPLQCFVPSKYVQENVCIGGANGDFSLTNCFESGRELFKADFEIPQLQNWDEQPISPLWDLPLNRKKIRNAKRWVDFLHDVTANDIRLAARENYQSVEHFKRYTTTGMAPDQGKTSNVNGLAILGLATARSVGEVGTTKFRPPYTPVTMGALCGRNKGAFFAPLRTLPAHQQHLATHAMMEDYGSWLRPVCYPLKGETEADAVNREVLAVRNHVGILDYSPLGKIDIRGPDAAAFLNWFYINQVKSLKVGKARYGLMLSEHGNIMDDGVFCRLAEDHFWVTCTSGAAQGIAEWFDEWRLCEWPDMDVVMSPMTTGWGTISLQGPKARNLLMRLRTNIDLSPQVFPHMSVCTGEVEGVSARILRTSFTGETGYEISVPASHTAILWERLMTVGADLDLTPFGIEALMVLRTEKGFAHVGMDTDSSTIPADIGFGRMVQNKKADFIGKRSLFRPQEMRNDREVLVGLQSTDNRVLRVGAMILGAGHERPPAPMEGRVTSSCYSPTLDRPVALALLKHGQDRMGETVRLYDISGDYEAVVGPVCSYDPHGERFHV